jgi:hypothetical protein
MGLLRRCKRGADIMGLVPPDTHTQRERERERERERKPNTHVFTSHMVVTVSTEGGGERERERDIVGGEVEERGLKLANPSSEMYCSP